MLAAACALLPNVDAIGFNSRMQCGDEPGHCGFFHVLTFDLLAVSRLPSLPRLGTALVEGTRFFS